MKEKKLALCQPYFAPYLGYFQLINAVDIFVSYDDVNFIKGGWINRNKIRVNGNEIFFHIPLVKQSQNKKINETFIYWTSKDIGKFLKTIKISYPKSTYKNEVIKLIESIFESKPRTIADLSLLSIRKFCEYLDIKTEIKVASKIGYKRTDNRLENIINICKKEKSNYYINPIGGTKLYNKQAFKSCNIKLAFIKSNSSLSIIDECLSNPKEEIKVKLSDYTLV